MAVAALRSTLRLTPLLGCRCYSHAAFSLFVIFLVCRVAAHLHFPPQFRKRRLQDLVYFVREHTEIMMGRDSLFVAEGKEFSEDILSQILSYYGTAAVSTLYPEM